MSTNTSVWVLELASLGPLCKLISEALVAGLEVSDLRDPAAIEPVEEDTDELIKSSAFKYRLYEECSEAIWYWLTEWFQDPEKTAVAGSCTALETTLMDVGTELAYKLEALGLPIICMNNIHVVEGNRAFVSLKGA